MSDLSLLKALVTHPTVSVDEARALLKKIGQKKSRIRQRERMLADLGGRPPRSPGLVAMKNPERR